MNKELFQEEVFKLGIVLDEYKLNQLERFYELLISWNEKINLTTITKKEEVYLKHFYDSLTLIKAVDLTKNLTLLDVGSGAGFPGIVLKIVFPNLKITLLDSMNKRINYLNEIIHELELKDIDTICARCEEFAKVNREKYDLAVARAVSHLEILAELILPIVKVNGYFLAMKSNALDEIDKSRKILKELNSSIISVIEFQLPIENSNRTLIKIKKNSKTSSKYPRKYDQIKKDHLKKGK